MSTNAPTFAEFRECLVEQYGCTYEAHQPFSSADTTFWRFVKGSSFAFIPKYADDEQLSAETIEHICRRLGIDASVLKIQANGQAVMIKAPSEPPAGPPN